MKGLTGTLIGAFTLIIVVLIAVWVFRIVKREIPT